jgi:hypothetical protein
VQKDKTIYFGRKIVHLINFILSRCFNGIAVENPKVLGYTTTCGKKAAYR